MAIEDYVCSLLLSRCGHALLATGNGLASCDVEVLSPSGLLGWIGVFIFHVSYLKRTQEVGVSEISPANSCSRAHAIEAKCSMCVCVCENIKIGLRRRGHSVLGIKWDPKRLWCRLLQCFCPGCFFSGSSPSTCILLTKIRKKIREIAQNDGDPTELLH